MDRTVTGVVNVDGYDEPVVLVLTEPEMEDETKAPIWIVEIWDVQQSIRTGKNVGKWQAAADFKKHGIIVPVTLEKAIQTAKKRQTMRPDYTYRVRNIQTNDEIMAAVL